MNKCVKFENKNYLLVRVWFEKKHTHRQWTTEF